LLRRYIQQQIRDGGNLDVIFKLDDEEEDRWGTEIGFFSSDFGDDKDIPDKRPRLELNLEIPYPVSEASRSYSLKSGKEKAWPVQRHKGAKLLLAANFPGDSIDNGKNPDAVNPDIWVRGGKGDVDENAPWVQLRNPLKVEWDWSQFKISARPTPVQWGFEMILNLPEYWVTARYQNLPRMLLLSPSGKVRETWGLVTPTDAYTYRIAFRPDEPGLWRYMWFFLPTREVRLHTHENRGMFYAAQPMLPPVMQPVTAPPTESTGRK